MATAAAANRARRLRPSSRAIIYFCSVFLFVVVPCLLFLVSLSSTHTLLSLDFLSPIHVRLFAKWKCGIETTLFGWLVAIGLTLYHSSCCQLAIDAWIHIGFTPELTLDPDKTALHPP
ncbi:hypothetical protein BCR44DRAFT_1489078, partial [Catenaria anguillulae PL171]